MFKIGMLSPYGSCKQSKPSRFMTLSVMFLIVLSCSKSTGNLTSDKTQSVSNNSKTKDTPDVTNAEKNQTTILNELGSTDKQKLMAQIKDTSSLGQGTQLSLTLLHDFVEKSASIDPRVSKLIERALYTIDNEPIPRVQVELATGIRRLAQLANAGSLDAQNIVAQLFNKLDDSEANGSFENQSQDTFTGTMKVLAIISESPSLQQAQLSTLVPLIALQDDASQIELINVLANLKTIEEVRSFHTIESQSEKLGISAQKQISKVVASFAPTPALRCSIELAQPSKKF